MTRPFRHELKFYISYAEYEVLSRRLSLTMDRDANTPESGQYFIRSLYFDDYQDSALQEKLDGNDSRDKIRIRIYNLSDRAIKLERKHKEGPYIQKQSLPLSREQCDLLIRGQCSFLLRAGQTASQRRFAQEMYAAFRTRLLKPRALVDYWREAYVFPQEDVRITFDKHVRTAYRATDLFNSRLPTYPAADEYGMILEVKFNEYLPGYIHTLIQPVENAQRSAISKYCLSRKYE